MDVLFDIETDGFYQDCTKIHCIALKRIGVDKDVILYSDDITAALDILSNPCNRLIGHNIIQFDIPVLEKLYPNRTFTHNVLDTFNLSMIVFPDRMQHSLEAWGKDLGFEKFNPLTGQEFTPEEWKERKKIKNSAWDKYTDEMGAYCQQDVRVTEMVLWQCQVDTIPEYVIELSNNFAWCISSQIIAGHKIDRDGLLKLNEQIEHDEVKAADELLKSLPSFTDYEFKIYKRPNQNKGIKAGDIECIELNIPFNLNSIQHWMRYLREKYNYQPPVVRRKGKDEGTASLNASVLEEIEDDFPEINALLSYRKATKIRKMIYNSPESVYNLLDKDGYIHGKLYTEGTVSGRCTHNKPNLSTMPSVKLDSDDKPILGINGKYAYEVRSLFVADTGFVQIGFDAKALEVCCLAHYVNDKEFTKQVETGDIHTWTQNKAGLHTRKQAKTFMYAFLYGAGLARLAHQLSEGSDTKYTKESVKKVINNFKVALPGLQTLLDRLSTQYKELGGILGLDGRLLQARSEHILLNLLLQSTGAVIMKQCLVYLKDELDKAGLRLYTDYKFVLNVHDEVQSNVKEEFIETYKECVQRAVDRTNKRFDLNCKLQVDIKVGRNWAECH